jgi:hypothetical protein
MNTADGFFDFCLRIGGGPGEGTSQDVLVIFTSLEQFEINTLMKAAADSMMGKKSTPKLLILGMEYAEKSLNKILDSEWHEEANPYLLRLPGKEAQYIYSIDQNGELNCYGAKLHPDEKYLLRMLRRQGMTHILRKHDGILNAPDTYHFVKPSGKHTRAFIRVAEVLSCSSEIDFIATGLLKNIASMKHLQRIYCDTGSIISVASRALELSSGLTTIRLGNVIIDSFGSYGRFEDYEFSNNESLVLISASTSDSLAKKLISEKNFGRENLLTLYGLFDGSSSTELLCDLRANSSENPEGFEIHVSHSASKCPECQRGSVAITIRGESFIPDPPNEKVHIIKASDAPSWLKDVFVNTAGKGVFKAFWKLDDQDIDDIYIDVDKLMELESYKSSVESFLSMRVPATTTHLVHMGGKSDRDFADRIAKHLITATGTAPTVVPVKDCGTLEESKHIVFVAGASSTGTRLYGASRSFRNSQATLSYLIGVGRSSTAEKEKELRSNLQPSQSGGKRPLATFLSMHLPDRLSRVPSAFLAERELLAELKGMEVSHSFTAMEIEWITKRFDLLQKQEVSPNQGADYIFWDSPLNKQLKLRAGFAFLPGKEVKAATVTHADLLFCMTAVLHNLRTGRMPMLVASVHQRMFLSPKNFDRYNDGIIQASIIRMAHPIELDYSCSETISAQMREILTSMLGDVSNDQAEALPEFLLSLACRRLRLYETHHNAITKRLNDMIPDYASCPQLSILAKYLAKPHYSSTQESASS